MLICIRGKDFEEDFSTAGREAGVHFGLSAYLPDTYF